VMWVVIGGLLVFFMQAGFALIEAGSVRSKNTVNVLMKNYTDMAIGGLIFYILGYGLMAGNNPTGYVGQSEFLPEQLSNMQW
ncbi:UNVERIFIED_CONTAM: ammonium transporter, partial [Bacteroidetes bacterium 56_B9]